MQENFYRCSIKDAGKLPSPCVKLMCTVGKVETQGITMFPQLAPSKELYQYYLANRDINPNWWDKYRERFLEEMQGVQMQIGIHTILQLLQSGIRVAIMCFCPNANTCHTSLLEAEIRRRIAEIEEGKYEVY